MPSSVAGSSVTFQSYPSPTNAQVSASKQAPPPSRKNTTLVGSARRSKNEKSLPLAHSGAPPGPTFSHVEVLAAGPPVADATWDGRGDDPVDWLPARFVPQAEANIAIAAATPTLLQTNLFTPLAAP